MTITNQRLGLDEVAIVEKLGVGHCKHIESASKKRATHMKCRDSQLGRSRSRAKAVTKTCALDAAKEDPGCGKQWERRRSFGSKSGRCQTEGWRCTVESASVDYCAAFASFDPLQTEAYQVCAGHDCI